MRLYNVCPVSEMHGNHYGVTHSQMFCLQLLKHNNNSRITNSVSTSQLYQVTVKCLIFKTCLPIVILAIIISSSSCVSSLGQDWFLSLIFAASTIICTYPQWHYPISDLRYMNVSRINFMDIFLSVTQIILATTIPGVYLDYTEKLPDR